MARKKQSRGICTYCGKKFSRGGMIRHLEACPQRKAVFIEADKQRFDKIMLYHLRAEDAWSSDFWLDLEVRGSATLKQLDRYLRAIWLECCNHLSMFSIGGWGGEEIPMKRRVDKVFEPGVELTHIYDFGTSSYTKIKYISKRRGKATTSHPIALMARNVVPEFECIKCGQPAQWLCDECTMEYEILGTLCDQHAEEDPHEEYGGPYPMYNSPRTGLCGYDGPAEPPY